MKTLLLGFSVGWMVAGLLACSSAPPVTAADADQIQSAGSQIAHCQIVGRAAKSYRAYECCMIAAALIPGAACSPAVLAHPQQDAAPPAYVAPDAGNGKDASNE